MPAKLRVLMTTDTLGGVWTYALELARALADRAQIWLASMGAPLSAGQRAAAVDAGAHICESGFRLEWMDEPWDEVADAGAWLLDLERRLRPDVVHLNNYCHGALRWRAPVLMAGHSCVCSWWEAVHGRSAPPEWDIYRAQVAAGLRAAAVVVAPTNAMLQALGRLYGPLSDGRVVHNGLDIERFAPAAKENVILSAGRLWDQAKNISKLAEIAPKLAWPVHVAGDCRSPDNRETAFHNVCPLGRLDRAQLAVSMSRAAIYALPARYEPFGLSILEAAASGCALVVGDIPSLREVWEDAACYVTPEDASALHDALSRVISDMETRDALARRARDRARRFSLQRMTAAYWDIYCELAGLNLKVCFKQCGPVR